MTTVQAILNALPDDAIVKLGQHCKLPTGAPVLELRRRLFGIFQGDLSALYFKCDAAGVKMPVENHKTLESVTLVSPMSLYSTKFHAGLVGRLDFTILHEHVKAADEVDVAAAFYDTNFLMKLFAIRESGKPLRRIRLLFNGLAGVRLDEQLKELSALQSECAAGNNIEIRLHFENGLFHSKLFLFHSRSPVAMIGSANATMAAMQCNEEILLGLGTETAPIFDYFESVWEQARTLESLKREEPDPRNLVQFFRTGILYFKPATILQLGYNPFSSILRELPDDLVQRIGGKDIPHAERNAGITPFSLRLALGMDDEDDEDEARVHVRPYSIETSLGYWVPKAYQPEFERKLDEAADIRRKRYENLARLIQRNWPAVLVKAYQEYQESVVKLFNAAQVHPDGWDDKIATRNFESFVKKLLERLSDDAYLRRLCRPYTAVALPEIWDDPVSAREFTDSFFAYLEYAGNSPLREPRIVQNVRKVLPKKSFADHDQIRAALEKYLERRGWRNELWLADVQASNQPARED